IHVAEHGMPVSRELADEFRFRQEDLGRRAETRSTFLKADGAIYKRGENFRQPALAKTLRELASSGSDYIYGGPWGERLIAAIQGDGGKMTMDDLRRYEVI